MVNWHNTREYIVNMNDTMHASDKRKSIHFIKFLWELTKLAIILSIILQLFPEWLFSHLTPEQKSTTGVPILLAIVFVLALDTMPGHKLIAFILSRKLK